MAEIEDVAGPAAGARQHIVGRRERPIERAEQQRRIEIALDGAVEADALPGLVERRPPVGADDVPPASRSSPRIAPVPTPK